MKVFSSVLLYLLSFMSLRGESFQSKSVRFNQVQTATMQSLMKNIVSDFEGARGWIPLGLTDDMDDEFPKSIQILGGTYILWKNMRGDLYKSDWIVTKPLSHTDSSVVMTFPTHTTRDIIWAYLPFPGFNESFPELPERLLPELNNANRITVTRDLPYSFDFTIENFMDPAHIPFAHHSFQGTREDAGPMQMEILTDAINNHTHCEVLYLERYKSKERPGIVSFISPIYYNLQIFNQNMTFFIRPLIIIVVPIVPGKTKIFLSAIAPRSFVSRFIPKWWIHAFYLRFLDSDIWIHDQEKLVRCGLSSFPQLNAEITFSDPLLGRRPGSRPLRYSLMTESDRGCIAWRKWWKHHMEHLPLFGTTTVADFSPLSDQQKRERYFSHTAQCRHCMRALAVARIAHMVNPVAVFLSFILLKNKFAYALVLAGYFLVNRVVEFVEKALIAPEPWLRTSAAQFL